MANTFLPAQGMKVGKSLCEKDLADTARRIMDKAKAAKLRHHAAGRRHRGDHFKANAPSQPMAWTRSAPRA